MGPEGPTGPSDAFAYIDSTENDLGLPAATLNLDAGFFVLNAKVQLNRPTDSSPTSVHCVLSVVDLSGGPPRFDVADAVLSDVHIVLPLATAADLMTGGVGGVATLNCTSPSATVTESNVTLVAIQVGNLTTLP